MKLENSIVVVTGGAASLGTGVACRVIENGGSVVIPDLNGAVRMTAR